MLREVRDVHVRVFCVAMFAVSLVAAFAAPVAAFASDDAGNDTGAFTVSDGTYGTDYTYADGVLSITGGSVQVANTDPEQATSNRIEISGHATVTFWGLNIETAGSESPVTVDDTTATNVEIRLAGENHLKATGEAAALRKSRGQSGGNDTSELKITSAAGDGSAQGSLTAEATAYNAAGIGASGYHGDVTNIEIAGGTVTARGGSFAAGIGSSEGGSVWNVVVSGGVVTSIGGYGFGAGGWSSGAGSRDAKITGGIVLTNAYAGHEPAGGMVSTDNGATWTVSASMELPADFELAEGSKLIIPQGVELTVPEDVTLASNGSVECMGSIAGSLQNNGDLWCGSGVEDSQLAGAGAVHRYEVEVTGGTGSGAYNPGDTVAISVDAPTDGVRVFDHWSVVGGTAELDDAQAAETTFTMSDGFARIEAVYRYVWGTIATADGETIQLTTDQADGGRAYFDTFDWCMHPNSTLTLNSAYYDGVWNMHRLEFPYEGGILDLDGATVETSDPAVPGDGTYTIKNGVARWFHYFGVMHGTLTAQDVRFEPISPGYGAYIQVGSGAAFINTGGVSFGEGVSFQNDGTVHTVCNDTYDYGGVVIKDQHVFDQAVATDAYLASKATCTEAAQYYYSCTCGAVGTETFLSGDPLGHSWTATETIQPTATEQGYTLYTCERCGVTEQRDFVPATGTGEADSGQGGTGTNGAPGASSSAQRPTSSAIPATGDSSAAWVALAVAGTAILVLGMRCRKAA